MNNVVKHLGLTIIVLIISSLIACSKYHPIARNVALGVIQNSADVQTYALTREKGYPEDNEDYSRSHIINPLIAPTNQTYYFDFDSIKLIPRDLKAICIQARYLSTHASSKIRLEGNTDNRGSREYNIGLGWWRDQSVARLLKQEGVVSKQIDMVSYGKECPIVNGNNESAWSLNRRVNLIYETY